MGYYSVFFFPLCEVKIQKIQRRLIRNYQDEKEE